MSNLTSFLSRSYSTFFELNRDAGVEITPAFCALMNRCSRCSKNHYFRYCCTMNTRSMAKTPSVSPDDLDLAALLREVSEADKHVPRTENALKALNNKGVSNEHWKQANKTKQSFIEGLEKVGEFEHHFQLFYFYFFTVHFISPLWSPVHLQLMPTASRNGRSF